MSQHGIRTVGIVAAAIALAGMLLGAGSAFAQTKTVRLAKQFGISYLPLTIMEQKKLLEAAWQDAAASTSRPNGCSSPAGRR